MGLLGNSFLELLLLIFHWFSIDFDDVDLIVIKHIKAGL